MFNRWEGRQRNVKEVEESIANWIKEGKEIIYTDNYAPEKKHSATAIKLGKVYQQMEAAVEETKKLKRIKIKL